MRDTYGSQVRVGLLRVQALVVLDVLEGLVHQTSVAALVTLGSGAFHQVLLAQRHHLAGLLELLTLQSSGGTESPAGATLTLRRADRTRWWWRNESTQCQSFVAVNFCVNLRAKAEGTNRTTENKRIHPPAAPWPIYSELAPPVWQHQVKNVCWGAERTGCALMEGGRRGIGWVQ